MLSPSATGAAQAKRVSFERLNLLHGAVQVQSLNPGHAPGQDSVAAPAVYMIELPPGTDLPQAIRDYQQSGLFRYVEPDATGAGGGQQDTTPNEGLYYRQWGLHNSGSFSMAPARAGADIKMPEAWARTQGDATITVAIIDSGCKLDHPEFKDRIWRNLQEIPGNKLDDDHNGYVDDVQGWNFASNNNNPTDDFGHGTNVTGIIGATGNNASGYAGINWGCKLMICKGLDNQNLGSYSWWTSAIYYAVNNGARVINMSLGGSSPSQSMQDAVTYANKHGVTVVACMMNTNSNTTYYPAGLTGVIAVGATNPDDSRASPFFWDKASGSNYGNHISVVAPGNYIYGLYYKDDREYGTYWGGTSQATPHVTGVVSLLLTLRPLFFPTQVKYVLQSTADDQVGPANEDKPGWDPYYGYGRLNAARVMATVVTAAQELQVTSTAVQMYPNPAHHQLTLRTTDARLLHHPVQIFNSVGQLVHEQLLLLPVQQLPLSLKPGLYWLTVAGTNARRKLVVQE